MTRIPFDQLSKQFLEEFLTPLGTVERSLEVPGESRFVDIWFVPSQQPVTEPVALGLLSRIAATSCLIEPFRNQPTLTQVRNCLLKLLLVQADFQRKARRDEESIKEADLPQLWIFASSASDYLLNQFDAKVRETWLEGVYFLAHALKTAIIAIDRLPTTQETLLLRILGKGITQQQAIDEVLALPIEDPRRAITLQLLANWKITIEVNTVTDEEERALIMALSPAFLEWEQQIERRGIEQGIEQGQRLVVENLLKVRFGELDSQLTAIIPSLLELSTEEYTHLLLQLSKQELLDRFGRPNA